MMKRRMCVSRCCCDPCGDTVDGATVDAVDFTDNFTTALESNWRTNSSPPSERFPNIIAGQASFYSYSFMHRFNKAHRSGIKDFTYSFEMSLGVIPPSPANYVFEFELFENADITTGVDTVGIMKNTTSGLPEWFVGSSYTSSYSTAQTVEVNLVYDSVSAGRVLYDVTFKIGGSTVHTQTAADVHAESQCFLQPHFIRNQTVGPVGQLDDYTFTVN